MFKYLLNVTMSTNGQNNIASNNAINEHPEIIAIRAAYASRGIQVNFRTTNIIVSRGSDLEDSDSDNGYDRDRDFDPYYFHDEEYDTDDDNREIDLRDPNLAIDEYQLRKKTTIFIVPMNLHVDLLFSNKFGPLNLLDKFHSIINLKFVEGDTVALGNGAGRQFLRQRFDELITCGYLTPKGKFVYLNLESTFWKNRSNVMYFCHLIYATKRVDGCLPYHLSPVLLSHINDDFKIGLDEAEFFLEKIDKQVFDAMKRDSHLEMTLEEMGCTKLEYMREILDPYESTHLELYELIGRHLELLFVDNDEFFVEPDMFFITTFSAYLSGYYTLDADSVLRMVSVHYQKKSGCIAPNSNFCAEEHVTNMLIKFISSLTENELIQMLISWTSNPSPSNKIKIYVVDDQVEDLRIQTCYCTVSISSRFFVDSETLNRLKISFIDGDKMVD